VEHSEIPKPGLPSAKVNHAVPSIENTRDVVLRAFEIGRVTVSEHFDDRCQFRNFSTLDAQELVECGDVKKPIVYDPEYNSFKIEFCGKVDNRWWKLVVGVDCMSDFCQLPRIILITVHRLTYKRARKKK